MSERDKSVLIGGFIFLRYISPAIISPEVYGLIECPLKATHRRTLVLVFNEIIRGIASDFIIADC
jgi:hypothetical protein